MTLKVELSPRPPQTGDAGVIALVVHEGPLAKQKHFARLDAELGGGLSLHASNVDFTGRAYQSFDLPTLGKITARRVVLIGLGPAQQVDAATLRHVVAAVTRIAGNVPVLALSLPEKVRGEQLRAVAEGVVLGAYRFTKYLTGERVPRTRLGQVNIHVASKPTATEKRAVETGVEIGEAVCIARDAVNEPPNELTPAALAKLAQDVAKRGKLKATVLDKAAIKKAGMQLHYAVGQGSENEPRFIHLSYAPKGAKKKIVFVGKGLTFDSGGLCIKPAPGMGEMKSDMGGAAAVIALMAAVAALRPKVEVHAVVGAAENMPDGTAYRPGDVFGSLDGKTVEIVNTDAEGRLVLADALTYARRLEPDLIVDAATLTGACVVALGKSYSAFYTEDDKLARQFQSSAKQAGESFWRMPLVDEYKEQLKSDIADLKHTGDRFGGSITAALFLREFTGDVPWIHCDVAAPVLYERARGMYPKGGTGHPVLTFVNLVEEFG
jgi:leucyl aminopeptidase